jgi:hypothetical protein
MKTLKSIGLIVAASMFTAPSLFAAIIGTGTLTITAPGLPDVNGPYAVQTTAVTTGPNLGNFETFCIGSQVDYNSGQSYTYSINTAVQPFTTENGGGLQYVALGTAWLYSQYRAGHIGDGSSNDANNDALQAAIWFLQGQAGGINNSFVTLAATAVGGVANLENLSNGAFNVYALNLSVGSGNSAPGDLAGYAQPQLCLIPVPEPATIAAGAMLLLPLGASMVRVLRNRKS